MLLTTVVAVYVRRLSSHFKHIVLEKTKQNPLPIHFHIIGMLRERLIPLSVAERRFNGVEDKAAAIVIVNLKILRWKRDPTKWSNAFHPETLVVENARSRPPSTFGSIQTHLVTIQGEVRLKQDNDSMNEWITST